MSSRSKKFLFTSQTNREVDISSDMVTGLEAIGLTLGILPLLVNQLDGYVRGIEKIKVLRRCRIELAGYSRELTTQRTLLLNTLEQALDGVIDDEDELSELICNPRGEGWKNPVMQERLHQKLDRNYDVFINNMDGLFELLDRLSKRLEISVTDTRVSGLFSILTSITTDASLEQTPVTDTWNVWKFRKILNRAVYDDLLAKIDRANTILNTLLDQSVQREETRLRRQPWNRLLRRYKRARKHADALCKTIIGGNYWHCRCEEQHCIYLHLQTNPLESTEEISDTEVQYKVRMNFSNTKEMSRWTWTEVVFESWRSEEIVTVSSLSLHDDSESHRHKKRKVHFLEEEKQPSEKIRGPPTAPPIQDFCSSLHIADRDIGEWDTVGFISSEWDSSVQYMMHAAKKRLNQVPQKPLREVLSKIHRNHRLHIAAGLACGMIQFCGNWLKAWWDSSDVHLAASSDGHSILLDHVYLSWPLSTPDTNEPHVASHHPRLRNNLLLPLGLTLVELSLGKSLGTLLVPEDEGHDTVVTKYNAASRLINMVYNESGQHYGDAVNSCLSWSGTNSLCFEKRFEERVFDKIISPLLRDLVHFEGMA